MNLLFIPGFLGSIQESQFLNETSLNISTFDPQKFKNPLSLLDQLNREKPEYIYAYSMGGRLLLSIYKSLNYRPKRVFLESVGIFNLSLEEKEARLKSDQLRSHNLLKDSQNFIEEWYKLPLWQFDSHDYEKMVKTKKDLLKEKDFTNFWGEILFQYSPGHFPKDNQSFFNLVVENPEFHLLVGEKDTKYFTLAKSLKTKISSCKRVHTFPKYGHNLHFQCPKGVSKLLKTLIF